GQQSIVRPGEAPTEPAPVPSSLLLKVAWPGEDKELRQHEFVVTGQTDPGNRVVVEGAVVRADKDGRFERKVMLPEGKSSVKVVAMGMGGLVAEDQHHLEVDTKAPAVKLHTGTIWKTTKSAPP
ncbi:hypothetical protein D7V93_42400, partial [Corallococcus llansteffanensis]